MRNASTEGGVVSGAIKFQTFAEEWFEKYAEKQLKESAVTYYRNLSKRVYIALGAKRINKIIGAVAKRKVRQPLFNMQKNSQSLYSP